MDQLTSSVIDYLILSEVNQALLITGKWGVGKTYYVRNSLRESIEQLQNPSSKEKYQFVYVSLNGLSKVEDIYGRILASQLPRFDNKFGRIGINLGLILGKHVGFDFEEIVQKKDLLKFSDVVLCLDDLERISPNLDVEEVLGFINTEFTEINGLKTIILANEEEIRDSNKADKSAEQRRYELIKEKTIYRTLHFIQDEKLINESFIRGRLEFCRESNRERIIEFVIKLWENSNCKNLRSLAFAMDNLYSLRETINDSGLPNELVDSIVLFIFSMSIEYKNGAFKQGQSLDNIEFEDLHSIDDRIMMRANRQTFRDGFPEFWGANEGEKTYKSNFAAKYLAWNMVYFFFFPSLASYIYSGLSDKKKLEGEIKLYAGYLTQIEEKPENAAYEKISNWKNLEDDDFIQVFRTVLTYIEEGKFGPADYPHLRDLYGRFEEMKVSPVNEEEISAAFEKGLKKSITPTRVNHLAISRLKSTEYAHPDSKRYAIEIESFYHVQKAIQLEYKYKELLSIILKNDKSLVYDFFSRFENIPILQYGEDGSLAEVLYRTSPEVLFTIREIFDNRYRGDKDTLKKVFSSELNTFQDLEKKIEKESVGREIRGIKDYHFYKLRLHLIELIDMLSDSAVNQEVREDRG